MYIHVYTAINLVCSLTYTNYIKRCMLRNNSFTPHPETAYLRIFVVVVALVYPSSNHMLHPSVHQFPLNYNDNGLSPRQFGVFATTLYTIGGGGGGGGGGGANTPTSTWRKTTCKGN